MESNYNSYKAAHSAHVVPCGSSSTNTNPNFFDALENSGQNKIVFYK